MTGSVNSSQEKDPTSNLSSTRLPNTPLYQIISFLPSKELPGLASTSKEIHLRVLEAANANALYPIQDFVQNLINNLEEEKHSKLQGSLKDILNEIKSLPRKNTLAELNGYILEIKAKLTAIIQETDIGTVNQLRLRVTPPPQLREMLVMLALRFTLSLSPGEEKDIALQQMSQDLMVSGYFDKAVAAAKAISDPSLLRAPLLQWISNTIVQRCTQLMNDRNIQEAIKMAAFIPDENDKTVLFQEISTILNKDYLSFINVQKFSEAINAANLIPIAPYRAALLEKISCNLSEICSDHVAHDRVYEATHMAKFIPEEPCRSDAFKRILKYLAQSATPDRIIALAKNFPINFRGYKTFRKIVLNLALAGKVTTAIAYIEAIPQQKIRDVGFKKLSYQLLDQNQPEVAVKVAKVIQNNSLKNEFFIDYLIPELIFRKKFALAMESIKVLSSVSVQKKIQLQMISHLIDNQELDVAQEIAQGITDQGTRDEVFGLLEAVKK